MTDFGCLTTENSFSGTNGDLAFFAPERLELYRQVRKGGAFVDCDVEISEAFSAGLTMLEIAIGRYPLQGVTAASRLAIATDVFFKEQVDMALAEVADVVLRNVLKGLLAVDFKSRLTLRKLVGMGSMGAGEFDFSSYEAKANAFKKLLQE